MNLFGFIKRHILAFGVILLFVAGCRWPSDYPGFGATFVTGSPHVTSFGYFGTDTNIAQVQDNTNMIWTSAGEWSVLATVQQNNLGAVVDITSFFFDPNTLQPVDSPQDNWNAFVTQLAPFINNIHAFYLVDEPYGNAKRLGIPRKVLKEELEAAILIIKASGLNIPVATIFCDSDLIWNFSIPKGYDWIGMDCYGGFDSCDYLPVNIYLDIIKSNMNAQQHMILVPGTMIFQKTQCCDPKDVADAIGWYEQYYTYAVRHQFVAAIWGFIWPTVAGVKNTDFGAVQMPAMQMVVADTFHLSQYGGFRPEFDPNVYRNLNQFTGSDMAAFTDWNSEGMTKGYRSSLIFDVSFYATNPAINPSLTKNTAQPPLQQLGQMQKNAVAYWIMHGQNQAFPTSAEFDPAFYLQVNPQVAAQYGATNYKAAFAHWIQTGLSQGVRTSPAFDISFYAQNIGHPGEYEFAWNDWLSNGLQGGARASEEFNVGDYISLYGDDPQHPDIGQLMGGPDQNKSLMIHWLTKGLPAGLQGSKSFSPAYWLQQNPQISQQAQATSQNPYRLALIDWLVKGKPSAQRGVQ